MFGAVYAAEDGATDALVDLAQEFTPRFEVCRDREVVLDLAGMSRLFGDAREIADEIRREAADRGLRVRVASAGTRTAARLAVHHHPGVTVIEPGMEAATVAPWPIALLASIAGVPSSDKARGPDEARSCGPSGPPDLITLRRWGLTTLGGFAALAADDVAARLGQAGVAWQRLARGEDPRPLVAAVPEERFEQVLDLEWPIEGLEPLSFVLGRLMELLSAHLEKRNRAAAVLHVRLQLVSHNESGSRHVHERSLELPTPIRDARTLRTLAVLDLESHPPAAAIDRVAVAVDPTPGRIVQFSLLTRPLPAPEQISTLVARLDAVMGQGRNGSPAPIDSWQPGAFAMTRFTPGDPDAAQAQAISHRPGATKNRSLAALALRRFRIPVPARVRVDHGRPVRVMTDRHGLAGGAVMTCAGPWRTSGGWWAGTPASATTPGAGWNRDAGWDRDEWDVSLSDGGTYRLFREREADSWFVEGVID